MKEAYTHLAHLLQENSFTKVLDLGAWKGYGSLLAASYRATVDAVDNGTMPMRAPLSFLLDHKYITYFQEDITSYLTRYTGNPYDIIMMTNVLHFLWNNYLYNTLLPFFDQHLAPSWYAIINYYLADDPVFFSEENKHKHTAYSATDFTSLAWYTVVDSTQFWVDDVDKKSGKHQHHVGMVVMRKDA